MKQLKQPGASIGNTLVPHHNSSISLSTIPSLQVPPQLPLHPPPFTNKNSTCSNTEHKVGTKLEQSTRLLEHHIDKRRIKTKAFLPSTRNHPMHIPTPKMVNIIQKINCRLGSTIYFICTLCTSPQRGPQSQYVQLISSYIHILRCIHI